MDLDLLSDTLRDRQPALTGDLLFNLPDSLLTRNSHSNVAPRDEFCEAAGESAAQEFCFGQAISNQTSSVISKIEQIFESIVESILEEKEMVIEMKFRKKTGIKFFDVGAEFSQSNLPRETRAVKFPSRNPHEAWKFTALLRILELSHEALLTGVVTTKRDIYYRDPELFTKQAVVDRYVDDLAYTLGVERDALNVVAAAKGLVSGAFSAIRKDNSIIDYRSEIDGVLIPNTKGIESLNLFSVSWILVIEKEATFRTLATSQYCQKSAAGQGIIITAKGYPDLQTRQFLYLLSTKSPHIPIYCLVDFDADGIGIMSTYKYGSIALHHQREILAVPSVRWLGVRSSDIIVTEGAEKLGLLELTSRDRRIARRMLEKETMEEEGREVEWRRELQVMLMLNLKAEIQILSDGDGGLEKWLDEKLRSAAT